MSFSLFRPPLVPQPAAQTMLQMPSCVVISRPEPPLAQPRPMINFLPPRLPPLASGLDAPSVKGRFGWALMIRAGEEQQRPSPTDYMPYILRRTGKVEEEQMVSTFMVETVFLRHLFVSGQQCAYY